MTTDEPLDLAPILAREAAARPGPWTLHGTSTLYMNGWAGFFLREDSKPGQIVTLSCWPADAEFIAHARRDVPRLLAEVKHLRRLVRDLADGHPCRFDHHGGCQAHGYLSLEPGEKCPQAEAEEVVAVLARALSSDSGSTESETP